MTPAEVAAKLRQFNEWRRGDYEPSEQPEPPNPYEVGLVIDAAVEMIERLEAAGKERNVLKAKVERMTKRLLLILEEPEVTRSNSKALREVIRQANLALKESK